MSAPFMRSTGLMYSDLTAISRLGVSHTYFVCSTKRGGVLVSPHFCFNNGIGETTMTNPFSPPTAVVDDVFDSENNSGGGSGIVPPDGVKGWSWGAFLLNWIWAIFNKTWIGLLCLVPYIGFIFSFYLGFKGRELAWRNKRWDSVEHFNRVQKKWSIWAAILIFGVGGLGIVAAIAIPAYQQYAHRAHAG